MHDLSRMGERPFEDLCRALAVRVLGPAVQAFGDGPDGGREATFEGPLSYTGVNGPWHGFGVLQAKFRRVLTGSKDADWLIQQVTQELNAWLDPERTRVTAGRRPDYLIIATNARLTSVPSSGGIDRVRTLINGYADRLSLKGVALWDANQLSMYLDAYPDVRQGFSHLVSPADVLEKSVVTLSRLDDALAARPIRVGQGTPGNERAFRSAYHAAGGPEVLGEPTSEVYDDGPGWVQHFSGTPDHPESVICARYGETPVAVDAAIWDALRAISPGQLASVGYPVPTGSASFIDGTYPSITLDGGDWGPGQLIRHESGSWRWQPQLAFGFDTREHSRWTSTRHPMDLRLRCAAILHWQATSLSIDPAGRKRLRSALAGGPLIEVGKSLAEKLGVDFGTPAWELTPADEGYNDQRFASYHLLITGKPGRAPVGIWARFQLPDGLQSEVLALVDLRIDFTALPVDRTGPNGAGSTRLSVDDLRCFFTVAWTTANDHLPLAVTTEPHSQKPAGPAATELHLLAEQADAPVDGHPRTLPDMIDLSAFGEPTRESLHRMSIAVSAPPAAPDQVRGLVNNALHRMAAGFGFIEDEDDAGDERDDPR